VEHQAKSESYGAGHLTFDCPWCGAICGVGPDHLGEFFTCPECGKKTKMTEATTRRVPVTVPPDDAPHIDDSPRPFSCPWCGHESEIPPTHLGEHYECPACHQATKLTDRTLPSPDEEGAASKASRMPLLLGGLGLLVLVVVLALVLGGGPKEEKGAASTTTAMPATGTGTSGSATLAEPSHGSQPESPAASGAEPPEPPEPATPGEEHAAPPPAEPATPRPPSALDEAETHAAARRDALDAAQRALDAWREAHPAVQSVLESQAARMRLDHEARTLLEALDRERVTPEQVRRFNAAVHDFVAGDEGALGVAEQVVTELRKDPILPVRVRSWKELNFFEPRTLEVLEALIFAGRTDVPDEYVSLQRHLEQARKALTEAQAEVEAIRKAGG